MALPVSDVAGTPTPELAASRHTPTAPDTPSPCTPIPAVLDVVPTKPAFAPLVAVASPSTPVPVELAVEPETPALSPLVAVASPATPKPAELALVPDTPVVVPVAL